MSLLAKCAMAGFAIALGFEIIEALSSTPRQQYAVPAPNQNCSPGPIDNSWR